MEFVSAIIKIIVIDLVLSGDNAVVIGMAAHRLPPPQRRFAIIVGGGAAIVLRVLLTIAAALLMKLSGLRLIGGLLLIWIGFKLLKEEEEEAGGVKVAHTMRGAIVTILLADLIMSLDNVLGVAGASAGNLWLLGFGLAFSMAILMFMGSIVAELINKFGWLAYAGSAVIVWTGVTLIFEDPLLDRYIQLAVIVEHAIAAAVTVGTVVFAHWFYRVRNE